MLMQCAVYILQERISILMNMLPLNWYAFLIFIYFLSKLISDLCYSCDEPLLQLVAAGWLVYYGYFLSVIF